MGSALLLAGPSKEVAVASGCVVVGPKTGMTEAEKHAHQPARQSLLDVRDPPDGSPTDETDDAVP